MSAMAEDSTLSMTAEGGPRIHDQPAPLACNECRRRHLRCDGQTPVCGRCAKDDRLECSYTPSRRGRAKHTMKPMATPQAAERQRPPAQALSTARSHVEEMIEQSPPQIRTTATTEQSALRINAAAMTEGYSTISYGDYNKSMTRNAREAPSLNRQQVSTATTALVETRLITSFYTHFWPAHPFLVPYSFYAAQRYPHYLELVLCDVGYHYTASASACANSLLRRATAEAISAKDDVSPSRVQALLLYAILLHARHQSKEAEQCVSRAATLAASLQMHQSTFATPFSPVIAESYQRTWWELYSVDTYFAGLHHYQKYVKQSVGNKDLPLLPGSQAQYELGLSHMRQVSIQAFEQRIFTPDLTGFSSLCYSIDAVRMVDRVVSLADNARPEDVQAIDNALASWKYNVPSSQRDVINTDGEVDEVMFQAHCYIACASMFLHFPRSDLPATVPSAAQISCAKDNRQLMSTSTQHTVKAIAASKELAHLAALPVPVERHSPLITCALTLGCIVQLAAASMQAVQTDCLNLQHHRDRVVLFMSVLKHLGEKWSLAANANTKLKLIASTIFTEQQTETITPYDMSVVDSGYGTSRDYENIAWFDLFDPEQLHEGAIAID